VLTRVLQLVHGVLTRGIHVTKRDLFYTDVKLFKDQKDSDAVLDDISCMLGCTRNSLHVVASEKGVVVGRLQYRVRCLRARVVFHIHARSPQGGVASRKHTRHHQRRQCPGASAATHELAVVLCSARDGQSSTVCGTSRRRRQMSTHNACRVPAEPAPTVTAPTLTDR